MVVVAMEGHGRSGKEGGRNTNPPVLVAGGFNSGRVGLLDPRTHPGHREGGMSMGMVQEQGHGNSDLPGKQSVVLGVKPRDPFPPALREPIFKVGLSKGRQPLSPLACPWH